MKELIQEIANEKGFEVSEFESGEGDHVHLFVSAPPKLSPSLIVQYLKGITGRKMYEKFPDLRQQLWKGGAMPKARKKKNSSFQTTIK